MSRWAALLLVTWTALPLPWDFHPPQWVERMLYNARERDAVALERYRQGDRKGAVKPADTALRLEPQDPLVGFNAGTAHLAAGDAQGAVKLLEQATAQLSKSKKAPPPALPGKAWYNLGNAKLAARDAAGAVEAFKQALRAAPADADAKFNLELALREREKERLRTKSPQEGSRGDRGGGQEDSQAEGNDQPGEKQKPSPAQDPQAGAKNQPQEAPSQAQTGEQGQPSPQEGDRPFRFQDQPEMTAAEAAALLQSVENLEREQRRAEAARRSRERAADGKDW